jgi:predicted Zn-dependent protease
MRPVIHTTIDPRTVSIIHKVMEEQKCNKSAEVDHIVAEYEKRKKDGQIDEVVERVIEKLGSRKGWRS